MGVILPGRAGSPPQTPPAVIWHELECGAYRADLPLWLELAERAGGPVLDVGAGTGRVALELARAGYEVTALELDGELLQSLRERAARADLAIATARADARSFALSEADFALCLVPMQTIQLLGGAAGRLAFLRHAREHLREGGVLACAILGELEPFDCSGGGIGPEPESTTREGLRWVSRAIRVSETPRSVKIERERLTMPESLPPPAWPFPDASAPGEETTRKRDLVLLDRLDTRTLRREGEAAGFSSLPTRRIAATEEHVSSEVVVLHA